VSVGQCARRTQHYALAADPDFNGLSFFSCISMLLMRDVSLNGAVGSV
jgi:hypothetical protein